MKKLFLFLFLSFSNLIYAQLTVSPYNNGTGNNGSGANLQQFVQNNLVGSGILISNVIFTGANRQIGNFNSTNTVLFTDQGMDNGIILSTGEVNTAIGPNNEAYACGIGGYIGNTNTDPDLQILAGASIKDKAILEFDFVPQGPTIEFKYIFGSEEYPEFVGSNYNDAFGFFLSGPGINGTFSNNAINLAIIPNTATPVTINNVNGTNNSSYYVYNGDPGNATTIAPYNSGVQYIEYDGYTVSLTAKAQVQCGQTYHLKIAIGDASDQSYDSGVFLKGGSLLSEPPLANVSLLTDTTVSQQATIVRDCSGTTIVFTRSSGLDSVLTVNYQVSGSAVSGQDYSPLPNPVTFQIGQDSVIIPVTALQNGNGSDSLIITINQSTPCGSASSGTVVIYIQDASDIVVIAPDVTIPCSDNSVILTASASGGASPYIYDWSTGDSGDTINITVNTTGSQDYYITVTDACGTQKTDTVTVTLNQALNIDSLTTVPTIGCSNTGEVTAFVSNTSVNSIYTWSGPGSNSTNSSNSTTFSNLSSGWYYFTVQDNGCIDSDSIFVSGFNAPNAVITPDTTRGCGSATFILTNGSSNANTYFWNTGSGYYQVFNQDAQIITLTSSQNIYLVASDGTCSDTAMIGLIVNPLPNVNAGSDQTICSDTSVNLTATGATTYVWNNGIVNGASFTPPVGTTVYTVAGTDSNGCTNTDTVVVIVHPIPVISIGPDQSVCEGAHVTLTGSGAASYMWSPSNGLNTITDSTVIASPPTTITYTVTGQSSSGCTGTSSVTVTVLPGPVADFIPSVTTGEAPLGVVFENTSMNANSYIWNFGNGQSATSLSPGVSATYNEGGTYEVILIASNGTCTDTAKVTITVMASDLLIHAPNVFTPNGDNVNDVFYIGTTNAKTVYVEIFNRWGNIITKLEKSTDTWDGGSAPDGVYFYRYKITDFADEQYEGHGFFHLERGK